MRIGVQRLGAFLLIAAAALHVIIVPFAGLSELLLSGLALVGAAALWTGWRGLAWLVMVAVIVAVGGEAARLGGGIVPNVLLIGLILIDVLVVICIFFALWRPRPETGAT